MGFLSVHLSECLLLPFLYLEKIQFMNSCITNVIVKVKILENQNPKKNLEGYADPTAYNGLKGIIKEESESEKKNRELIHVFRRIASLAGFEIVGRITLKDKSNGKVYK